MNAAAEPIIRIDHLSKRFGKVQAVDDLNLTVSRGDVYGFLGPNGSGKSTTIRVLLGLVKADAGSVHLFGRLVRRERDKVQPRIGAMVERPDFYDYLSGRRNLELLARTRGVYNPEEVDRLLRLVDLTGAAHKRVKTYSTGMCQRLGLAQALMGSPDLIVLDEPTTGLDPLGMVEVRKLIRSLADEGITVFLSSHLLHEVEQTCTRMGVVHNGRLVAEGGVRELMQASGEHYLVEVDDPARACDLLENRGVTFREEDHGLWVKCARNEVPEINAALVEAGLKVYGVRSHQSLESLFMDLVGEADASIDRR